MNKHLKAIPKFPDEALERAFWETKDPTDYLDWQKAKVTVLPNPTPSTPANSLKRPQH